MNEDEVLTMTNRVNCWCLLVSFPFVCSKQISLHDFIFFSSLSFYDILLSVLCMTSRTTYPHRRI